MPPKPVATRSPSYLRHTTSSAQKQRNAPPATLLRGSDRKLQQAAASRKAALDTKSRNAGTTTAIRQRKASQVVPMPGPSRTMRTRPTPVRADSQSHAIATSPRDARAASATPIAEAVTTRPVSPVASPSQLLPDEAPFLDHKHASQAFRQQAESAEMDLRRQLRTLADEGQLDAAIGKLSENLAGDFQDTGPWSGDMDTFFSRALTLWSAVAGADPRATVPVAPADAERWMRAARARFGNASPQLALLSSALAIAQDGAPPRAQPARTATAPWNQHAPTSTSPTPAATGPSHASRGGHSADERRKEAQAIQHWKTVAKAPGQAFVDELGRPPHWPSNAALLARAQTIAWWVWAHLAAERPVSLDDRKAIAAAAVPLYIRRLGLHPPSEQDLPHITDLTRHLGALLELDAPHGPRANGKQLSAAQKQALNDIQSKLAQLATSPRAVDADEA